jgi:hypothetical protein
VVAITNIYPLPYSWLTKSERTFAFERFFNEEEKSKLLAYRRTNLQLLNEAQIIIIDNRKQDGSLGDSIRDSRLTGVINTAYTQKIVLEWSRFPEIFGKYPFITQAEIKKEKVIFTYQKTQDTPPLKIEITPKQVVKVTPIYSGISPTVHFNDDLGTGIILPQVPLHELQRLQLAWEIVYGIRNLDALPLPSIKISEKNLLKSREVFKQLPIAEQGALNIIIHPDAHNNHFKEKKWVTEKWVELIKTLLQKMPVKIFLTIGTNHPEVSEQIIKSCEEQNLSLFPLPSLSLAEYVGLLTLFPRKNTVFVGLESMACSHLAPGIGLKNVVIASDKVFDPLIFGPFGEIVVMSDDHKTTSVTVEKVVEAINLANHQR